MMQASDNGSLRTWSIDRWADVYKLHTLVAEARDADWATWTVPKDAGNSEAGQTGGYLVRFKNKRFAFATVHGAGHEVPTYKPAAALHLFKSYISGAWTKNN
jgi:hypothetical protein